MNCATCKRDIHVGDECYRLAKGVMGTKDFVDLASWFYCSVDCLEKGLGEVEANGKNEDEPHWFDRRTP
jgi:hypothetical protein